MIDSPEEKEAREESMAALIEGRINIAMSRHTDRWKPVFCEKMAIEIVASQDKVAREKDEEFKKIVERYINHGNPRELLIEKAILKELEAGQR